MRKKVIMTTPNPIDLPIKFVDAHGGSWTRARVSRNRLNEIQAREKELEAQFDAVTPTEGEDSVRNKLFDVRLKCLEGLVGDQEGTPLNLEDIDVSEAQHVYQAFWRNVWGLDPLGNLL
jgi:hypothetical protein